MKTILTEKSSPKKERLTPGFPGVNTAFLFSFLAHLAFLFLVGGVVLQYGRIESKNFMAETVESSPAAEETVEPVEPQPMPEESPPSPQEPESGSAASSPSSQDLITTDMFRDTLSSPSLPAIRTDALGVGAGVGGLSAGTGSSGGANGGGGIKKMANPFGSQESSADGLTGYLYDLKQSPDRKPLTTNADEVIRELIKNWDESTLQKFYKVPNPLTSFQFFIPIISADAAPQAFNAEKEVQPNNWLVFYQGKITSNVNGSFRFVGIGDDVLIVRFNKKFVLNGSWGYNFTSDMNNDKGEFNGPYTDNFNIMSIRVGSWFSVRSGETYPMDVLIGEIPGNTFSVFLMIQQKGKNYQKQADGQSVLLPIFQTAPTTPPDFEQGKNAPRTSGKIFSFRNDL